MRVSAVSLCHENLYANARNRQCSCRKPSVEPPTEDTVDFKGKGGQALGGAVGGAVGGAIGTAIIGGGSLAGAAAVAALGPIGLGLVALYAIGGAVVGGYAGASAAKELEDENDTDKSQK